MTPVPGQDADTVLGFTPDDPDQPDSSHHGTHVTSFRYRGLSILAACIALTFVAGAAVLGVGWHFSNRVLTPTEAGSDTVLASAGEPGTIVLHGGDYSTMSGRHGVVGETGGNIIVGVYGDVLARSGDRTIRAWSPTKGTLPENPIEVTILQDVFYPDPSALNLSFRDVTYPTEVGKMPAWVVPAAETTTWVIFIHGRGASRAESLRYLNFFHERGMPVMVPAYRNDAGAPTAPNGQYALGYTEWHDIDAALAYAKTQGAQRFIVAGWSMGAAIALQTMDKSDHAASVDALILDAPVINWKDTLRQNGRVAGVPGWLSAVSMRIIEYRTGLQFDDFDWVSRAHELPNVPIYIEHSDNDTFVPNEPTVTLAAARPDIVTFTRSAGAEHTREWNVDTARYERSLDRWLKSVRAKP